MRASARRQLRLAVGLLGCFALFLVLDAGPTAAPAGADARALSVPTTAKRLAAAVARKPARVRFRVALSKKPPVLSTRRLKGITGVLGSYATRATRNPKRNKNIRLAVHSIDGTLL